MNILCAIFRHHYAVEIKFSETMRKVGCTRCGKQWGMNDRVKVIIPWDSELEEMTRDHYPEVYANKLAQNTNGFFKNSGAESVQHTVQNGAKNG